MKELRHIKVLVDVNSYLKFCTLAKNKGMKLQAYIGQLIEREVEASSKSVEEPRR